jgi:hypothetical protein
MICNRKKAKEIAKLESQLENEGSSQDIIVDIGIPEIKITCD